MNTTGLGFTKDEFGTNVIVILSREFDVRLLDKLVRTYNFSKNSQLNIQLVHFVSIDPPKNLLDFMRSVFNIIRQNEINIVFEVNFEVNSIQYELPQLMRFLYNMPCILHHVIVLDTKKSWILDPRDFNIEYLD